MQTLQEELNETAGLRVLVVEDHADCAEVLETTLQHWGHQPRVCRDACEALAADSDFVAEVVLLDIGLPDMDGWELARRLQRQRCGRQPTLIAITAHGESKDYRQSREAGITYHLNKPNYREQLHQLLNRLRSSG